MRRRQWSAVAVMVVIAAVGIVSAPAQRVGASTEEPQCLWNEATIVGAGTINGTSGDDVIVGSDGPDLIRGNGGKDLICGGDGDDRIFGGSGADAILGEGGEDEVNGDAGDDELTGENGLCIGSVGASGGDVVTACDVAVAQEECDDVIKGGSGHDFIGDTCGYNKAYGGGGTDSIYVSGYADGGSGDDFCSSCDKSAGSVGPAQSFGEGIFAFATCEGCDDATAKGGSGQDTVGVAGGVADGGSGNDDVEGNVEGDEVRGGAGNDNVVNNSGGDPMTLNGGAGYDVCNPDNGADVLISCEA